MRVLRVSIVSVHGANLFSKPFKQIHMNTVQEIIDAFEVIPADKWTVGDVEYIKDGVTTNCAIGHLNILSSGDPHEFTEGHYKLKRLGVSAGDLIRANNGNYHYELEGTEEVLMREQESKGAKERSIAFLKTYLN